MQQPAIYNSVLPELERILPAPPSMGDVENKAMQTASTWQNITSTQQGDILKQRESMREDDKLELARQKQRQDEALKAVLFPLEVEKHSAELKILNADLSKATFNAKQAGDQADRERVDREFAEKAQTYYSDKANEGKDMPISAADGPNAASIADKVRRSILGSGVVDRNQSVHAKVGYYDADMESDAVDGGWIPPNTNLWQDPEVRRQYMPKVQLARVQKEINDMKLGITVNNLDSTAAILNDPANYGFDGRLTTDALEAIKSGAQKAAGDETQKDKKELIESKSTADSKLLDQRAATQEKLTKMRLAGQMDIAELNNGSRTDVANIQAEVKRDAMKAAKLRGDQRAATAAAKTREEAFIALKRIAADHLKQKYGLTMEDLGTSTYTDTINTIAHGLLGDSPQASTDLPVGGGLSGETSLIPAKTQPQRTVPSVDSFTK